MHKRRYQLFTYTGWSFPALQLQFWGNFGLELKQWLRVCFSLTTAVAILCVIPLMLGSLGLPEKVGLEQGEGSGTRRSLLHNEGQPP